MLRVTLQNDYYPFGMLVPNRNFSSPEYRYGFQGQEKDDEIKGAGNSLNYTFRMHDPRVGRFFAIDPLIKEYPNYTPYSFSGNKVISYRELEGQEEFSATDMKSPAELTAEMLNAAMSATKNIFAKTLTLFTSNKTDGMLVRGAFRNMGVHIDSDIEDATLGKMFKIRYQGQELRPSLTKSFWGESVDTFADGLDILAVAGMFAGSGATGLASRSPLLMTGGRFLRSRSGLLFGLGSREGNRLSHVLKHSIDDLAKNFHGVFSTKNAIGTIDEAYSKIKAVDVKKWSKNLGVGESETIGDVVRSIQKVGEEIREVFTVDLKKVIGFEGGKLGTGELLEKVKVVVKKGTDEVITAFPTKQ